MARASRCSAAGTTASALRSVPNVLQNMRQCHHVLQCSGERKHLSGDFASAAACVCGTIIRWVRTGPKPVEHLMS